MNCQLRRIRMKANIETKRRSEKEQKSEASRIYHLPKDIKPKSANKIKNIKKPVKEQKGRMTKGANAKRG